MLRDVMKLNAEARNFRVMGPDETTSNRLDALFEVTDRASTARYCRPTITSRRDGRVMEVLSEHMCQGWLEGYLLTGRHGFFSCYEAFIHIVDSMFNQHAKWLKTTRDIPWRRPIASLNYLLTSHVWRQDHNGFSHQDPGFIDHVVNKKADVVRVYLPPDANTLLSVADHCLRSRHYVNVIVAGKQPAPQWLDIDSASAHCERGIGVWEWASNDEGGEPDVVLACAGDVPTLETLAAVSLLRTHVPRLRMRVVNVVDLMTLQPSSEHPHGLSDDEFDELFTTDRPIIFAFHGYPWLIHRLTYRRQNHGNLHVRGYKEEGTTTTPFDMTVLNDLDRYHLALDVLARVERLRGDSWREARRAVFSWRSWPSIAPISSPTARTCPRSRTGGGPVSRKAAAQRLFVEQSQLEREVHVVGPMGQSQLLVDPLLVRVDRLGADEQLLADLGSAEAAGYEAQNVALSLRELLVLVALVSVLRLALDALGERARGRRLHVHVAVCDRSHRIHQLAVGCAFHEVAARACLEDLHQVRILCMHGQNQNLRSWSPSLPALSSR